MILLRRGEVLLAVAQAPALASGSRQYWRVGGLAGPLPDGRGFVLPAVLVCIPTKLKDTIVQEQTYGAKLRVIDILFKLAFVRSMRMVISAIAFRVFSFENFILTIASSFK